MGTEKHEPPPPVTLKDIFHAGKRWSIMGGLMLTLGWDLYWTEAWIFNIYLALLNAFTVQWLYRHNPGLLAERFREVGTGGQQKRDVRIYFSFALVINMLILLTPLDAKWFHWSPEVPFAVKVVGFAMEVVGGWFIFRAFADNTFLSPYVRVQEERKHKVITTGCYGIVRHPMYTGVDLILLSLPLMTGALVGLLPAIAGIVLFAVRSIDEEKLLITELEGYPEYKKVTKYRLFPYIW